jgi:hypothetical protein
MKPSKHRNVKVVVDGFKFDSKAEYHRYTILSLLQRSKVITKLQLQVKYLLTPILTRDDGKRERATHYVADFVYWEDGKLVVEDVKGNPKNTPEFIIKRKLMLEKHGITVREIRK